MLLLSIEQYERSLLSNGMTCVAVAALVTFSLMFPLLSSPLWEVLYKMYRPVAQMQCTQVHQTLSAHTLAYIHPLKTSSRDTDNYTLT